MVWAKLHGVQQPLFLSKKKLANGTLVARKHLSFPGKGRSIPAVSQCLKHLLYHRTFMVGGGLFISFSFHVLSC